MPFDGNSRQSDHQPEGLYQERRARAAALWREIPLERFDMRDWVAERRWWWCSSTACALGHLCAAGHDNWRFSGYGRRSTYRCPIWQANTTVSFAEYTAAQHYFGLSCRNAELCFGPGPLSARRHGRHHISQVTPEDVAKTLLALPYETEYEYVLF